MIAEIVGALLPHIGDILGLFGKRTDDKTHIDEQAEIQGEKIIDDALHYRSLRILIIVVVSAFAALYFVDELDDTIAHWNHRSYGILGLLGAGGLSAALRFASKLW